MGASVGIHFNTVKNEAGLVKCVPDHKYVEFPQNLKQATGELVLETEAYPMHLVKNREQIRAENWYWWTDAQFVPNNDSSLFVTGGMFRPRSNQAWIGHAKVPAGRIIKVDLNKLDGQYMNDTRTANYPKIQMHPSGKYFLYISRECITIETTAHVEVFNKHKDLRNCNYRFCSFAPNGKYLAILLSSSRHFEMIISMLNTGFTFNDIEVDLTRMIPEFRCNTYSEHIECKWTPDSEFIVVCSSTNHMFVLNRKLEFVVDITESILPEEVFPSWSGTFDFDPRSCHQVMAVGTNNRCLYFINIDNKCVLAKTDTLSKDAIDCVLYHPHGNTVAVATRDFSIYITDSLEAQVKFQIDMKFHIVNLSHYHNNFPAVIRLSYTSTGEQIASATCDGYVRVWQLPGTISLFKLCRQTILKHVVFKELHKLPLPGQIVTKLLSLPSIL